MNAYVDSSTLLRIILNERGALRAWPRITGPFASELIRAECLRTVDRARLRLSLDATEVARLRSDLIEAIDHFTLIQLDDRILSRVGEPFPTLIGTLDAIHLASASEVRRQVGNLAFATHDQELAIAATAMGFEVLS